MNVKQPEDEQRVLKRCSQLSSSESEIDRARPSEARKRHNVRPLYAPNMGIAYSIAAVDTNRGLIGAAGGVCVGRAAPNIVQFSYKHVPGKALLVTNAGALEEGSPPLLKALVEMQSGTNPSAILAAITDPAVDENYQGRQYGLVDFQGRAAGYTGQNNQAPKLDTQGTFSDFAFSAQGQLLYGVDTVSGMAEAFQNGGEGCDDLVDRLFLALDTVSQVGKGQDAENCPFGADVVFLRVDHSSGGKVLEILVDYQPGRDPFQKLQQQYEAWRASNPCSACLDQDACSPSFLFIGDGVSMHSTSGSCWDLCVPSFLVGLKKVFGWECNECLN